MKHIAGLINTGWQVLLGGLTLLMSQCVLAIPVDAEIKGDTFRWVSAQSSFDGGVTPSVWATPASLVPAQSYIPGASALASMPVSMIGPKGSSVKLNLQLIGMEYNSPEASGMTPAPGGSATVSLSGGLVRVQGLGAGDQSITLSREVTPFTHARPVISLGDSTSIVQAFVDAGAAPGRYATQVSIPLSYDYERAGVRIRYQWTLPLALTIEYTPAILNDVTLISPTAGVMTPRYYNKGGDQYVSGEAVYNGVASGYFSNGLRLRLKTGDNYEMVGPNNTTIPLSVSCLQCEQALLVDKGVMTLPDLATKGTRVPGVNVPAINFTIGVQFADVALSTLETGAYQGVFALLFEPEV
ncbi:hypothetical protein ACET8B_02050 [Aeromonas caviae]|uniref:hypothetical protein n=1 Tax=Aeromonas caviae TaxID=648 RepID=UPI0038D0F16C